jgi:hypothetical protein
MAVLGRYSDVATLRSSQGIEEPFLPPQYDVRLSHMGTNGFVLTGSIYKVLSGSRSRGGAGPFKERCAIISVCNFGTRKRHQLSRGIRR